MRYLAPFKVLISLGRGGRLSPLLAFFATLLLLFSFSSSQPSQALPRPHLGYGAFVANFGGYADDPQHLYTLRDMGFNWFVMSLHWADAEPSKGTYNWADVDNIITAAELAGLKPILRVTNAPGWARSGGDTAPPDNLSDFGDFMYALAQHTQGKVKGYVIWNEPNLSREWGGQYPDPTRYAQMLQAVYPQTKAGDPEVVVITAGMATTGESGCGVGAALTDTEAALVRSIYASDYMGDLAYLCAMYDADLGSGRRVNEYFDVLGSHPYGFPYAPEELPPSGLAFRRAEQQRQVMEIKGDSDKQIWTIEFGWILDPGLSCHSWGDWPTRTWQIVSETVQADYLVRAYQYAYENWPWMGVMNLFNLDFGADIYQAGWPSCWSFCNPTRFYSLIYWTEPCDPGHTDTIYRQAYYTLRDMDKPTSGSLSGHVRDNRGASFVGAGVEILGLTSTTTDLSGGYQFTNIFSNTYDLQASASTYGTLEPMRGVVVNEGEALTDVNFYLPPPDNVVVNWDFESDLAQWPIGGTNTPTISTSAHTGYKSAQLGGAAEGDSWVQQTVEIPADMYRPTLSFLYRYPSQDTGEVAQVTVAGIIESISVSSEWTHHWIDLDELQGETVTIRFTVSENGSSPSHLYLDEVSLGKASGGPYKVYFPLLYKAY